jgi:hypothetical protein
VKWDTVVVFQSAVGFDKLKEVSENLKIYPVPAGDELNLQWSSEAFEREFKEVEIINSLGQVCVQSELVYDNKRARLDVKGLLAGIYTLRLKSAATPMVSKRFIIAR